MSRYKYEDAIAGCAAGMVGTIFGYPLDTLKSSMQTSNTNLIQTVRHIYVNDGILGFYRGITSPLVALTVLNTINFSSYSYFHRLYRSRLFSSSSSSSSSLLTLKTKFYRFEMDYTIPLAAMSVGPIASLISTPFEFVKLQLQLDRSTIISNSIGLSQRKYSGSFHATKVIIEKYGIHKLYTGHVINTLREMVFLVTYFTTYETIKQCLCDNMTMKTTVDMISNKHLVIPLAGGVAGAIGWFVSFPLDCIKSRIQGQNIEKIELRSIEVFKVLLQTKGIQGLYSGVIPSILRAFIVSSTRFTVYEGVLSLF